MNAAERKALRAIFKFHAMDATRKIKFVDIGMLPPSLTIHPSNLVWQ
jgi:hypothetical protein